MDTATSNNKMDFSISNIIQRPHHLPTFNESNIKIIQLLGRGSFEEVRLVEVPRLGKVAYKTQKYKFGTSNEQDKQMRELTCSIMLNYHPNIVAFYGEVVDNFSKKSIGFLMEYMADGSLFSYIRNSKSSPISVELRNTWAYQIALGLAYMHSRNIMHRDLNPNNILLGPVHTAKIADFGTSKEIEILQMIHTQGHGTGFYQAPEIVLESRYSLKVDVYSYAMTLYFIFSSKIPFEDNRKINKMSAVQRASLTEQNKRPMLGLGVIDELISCCWKSDPTERPTMEEVEAEMSREKYPKI